MKSGIFFIKLEVKKLARGRRIDYRQGGNGQIGETDMPDEIQEADFQYGFRFRASNC